MAKAKAKAKKKVTTKKEVEPKMEGLGDLVEKVTEATGIKKVVKAVFGDDCGCDERREKLNKLLSFKTEECLTADEYKILDTFYAKNPNEIRPSEWRTIVPIGRRIFNQRINDDMGCGGCVREVISKLKKVYETYDKNQ
tara:strand:- start:1450 stop:1866 length:417 start_codon:yes stop_codon:yes gene_type:complete